MMSTQSSGEPTGEIPSIPPFDPLAPVAPEATRELDQWLLEQALHRRKRLLARRAAKGLQGSLRIIGGRSHQELNALRGEIDYLKQRLATSDPVDNPTGEVANEK